MLEGVDLILTLAGFGVGIVVGLTGMGGGALMTPILVLAFGVPPLAAVSSDLAARSLETAAIGGTPNTSTRMGVIRAPPPMPVRPTMMPTPRPASAKVRSMRRSSPTNTHLVH